MTIMNTRNESKDGTKAAEPRTVCFASCRKLNAQVNDLKRTIVEEFQTGMPVDGQMIQAAVNEAEALAWQTPYPHLFFPVLAREKAAAATQWVTRQQLVRHQSLIRALAA